MFMQTKTTISDRKRILAQKMNNVLHGHSHPTVVSIKPKSEPAKPVDRESGASRLPAERTAQQDVGERLNSVAEAKEVEWVRSQVEFATNAARIRAQIESDAAAAQIKAEAEQKVAQAKLLAEVEAATLAKPIPVKHTRSVYVNAEQRRRDVNAERAAKTLEQARHFAVIAQDASAHEQALRMIEHAMKLVNAAKAAQDAADAIQTERVRYVKLHPPSKEMVKHDSSSAVFITTATNHTCSILPMM